MAETAFENGRISNCDGLVTLTLTSYQVILHTVVHHSSTSTYMPNFIEIEERYCGRTYVRTFVRTYAWTDGWTDGWTFETSFIRFTLSKSRPKKYKSIVKYVQVLSILTELRMRSVKTTRLFSFSRWETTDEDSLMNSSDTCIINITTTITTTISIIRDRPNPQGKCSVSW